MVREFRITLPSPLIYTRVQPLPRFFFNTIVNPLIFNTPLVISNAFDVEENEEGT